MSRSEKGQAYSDTIVVKILDLRDDWKNKVPNIYDRDIALQHNGSNWKKFMSFCGKSHVINRRVNMSMNMYLKFIAASGLDSDKYWDAEANPNDYISHNNRKSSDKSTKSKKSVLSETKSASTVKHNVADNFDNKSFAQATISTFDQKMNSFRIHIPVYMCSLGICTDQVITDTNITYFRDIRDGKTDIKLFEYIVLSEYLMDKYTNCTNSDAKSTFNQIAALFNDIYVKTLYFGDI